MTPGTLSFDDGPSEWTEPILDLLFAHDVQASFFVTGQNILGRAPLLARMRNEGHTVGNHALTHRRLTELDDHDVEMELAVTSALIECATGAWPAVWRAPYFAADERVLAVAERLGLAHVGASVMPDDWLSDDAEAIARVVLAELVPGAVVSLHDGMPPRGGSTHASLSRAATVEAVRLILEAAG